MVPSNFWLIYLIWYDVATAQAASLFCHKSLFTCNTFVTEISAANLLRVTIPNAKHIAKNDLTNNMYRGSTEF